jgi:hypothetical protein
VGTAEDINLRTGAFARSEPTPTLPRARQEWSIPRLRRRPQFSFPKRQKPAGGFGVKELYSNAGVLDGHWPRWPQRGSGQYILPWVSYRPQLSATAAATYVL